MFYIIDDLGHNLNFFFFSCSIARVFIRLINFYVPIRLVQTLDFIHVYTDELKKKNIYQKINNNICDYIKHNYFVQWSNFEI